MKILNLFKRKGCKKCGWLVACDECSEEYDKIDRELKRLENERRNTTQ